MDKWTDCDGDIIIEEFDRSMLKISMANFDHTASDYTFLTKSDVIYLIKFLEEQKNKMCFFFEE